MVVLALRSTEGTCTRVGGMLHTRSFIAFNEWPKWPKTGSDSAVESVIPRPSLTVAGMATVDVVVVVLVFEDEDEETTERRHSMDLWMDIRGSTPPL